MASIKVQTGPVDAMDQPQDVAKEKWHLLMLEKRSYLAVHIPHDCRCLLEFTQQAEEMWKELGFKSADDMIRNGFELEPNDARNAVKWLKRWKPDEAVSYKTAVERARDQAATIKQGTRTDLQHSGNTTKLKGRKTVEHHLRRLAKHRPDILARYEAGELSAHAAALEAGFIHPTFQVRADDAKAALKTILRHYKWADLVKAKENQGDNVTLKPR